MVLSKKFFFFDYKIWKYDRRKKSQKLIDTIFLKAFIKISMDRLFLRLKRFLL